MIATYEPHACVVVYSVVDGNSFDMAAEIISYLWRFGFSKKATVLLVANKVDLERSRLVTCEGTLFHSDILGAKIQTVTLQRAVNWLYLSMPSLLRPLREFNTTWMSCWLECSSKCDCVVNKLPCQLPNPRNAKMTQKNTEAYLVP